MTQVTTMVESFWVREDAVNAGVHVNWANSAVDACGGSTDQVQSHYCPADDTIYIPVQYAIDLWNGVNQQLPSSQEYRGHGDFGVAFLIAHEYAHRVQTAVRGEWMPAGRPVKPFELEADCLAGVWANGAYSDGLLESDDVQEAADTTLAFGDKQVDRPDLHHGTSEERNAAFMLGYNTRDGKQCSANAGV